MSLLALALALLVLGAGTAAAFVQTSGRAGSGALKMLAASGYLAFALHLGALDTVYGGLVFLGLGLSWVGDLALIGRSRRSFVLGLLAFLLAHLGYGAAFAVRGVQLRWTAVGAVVMAGVAVAILRWLREAGLPRPMTPPIAAYLAAIGVMVALALGTRSAPLVLGATAFAASDVFVARQRFVVDSAVNRRVGLPLYFLAQLLIAGTVSATV